MNLFLCRTGPRGAGQLRALRLLRRLVLALVIASPLAHAAERRARPTSPSGSKSPIRTSSCAPAPDAAFRSSSSPRATSRSRSSCATPTGTRSAPTDGKEGWVHRSQLETTLTEAGGQKTLPRHRARRLPERKVQLGGGLGPASSRSRCSSCGPATGCPRRCSLEGTIGQVQGVFSGTDFWHLNLMAEPWSDQRLSPFFGIGVGRFKNLPNQSLVSADHDQRKTRQRRRSACATTSPIASSCAPTTRSTRRSSATRAPASTGPDRRLVVLLLTRPLKRSAHMRTPAPRALALVFAAPSAPALCAAQATPPQPSNEQVIEPQVDRRDVKLPKYPSNDFEIGVFGGTYATENFGSSWSTACAWATTSPRTFFVDARVRADQGQRRELPPDPARRHLRAAGRKAQVLQPLGRLQHPAGRGVLGPQPRPGLAAVRDRRHRQHQVRLERQGQPAQSPTINFGLGIARASWPTGRRCRSTCATTSSRSTCSASDESTQNLELTGGVTFYF